MAQHLERTTDYDDPRLVSVFDECSFWSSQFGALLFRHLALEPDLEVLDVACGAGFPLFELAQAYGPSCRFTGVDPWQAVLDRAAEKLDVYGLENVRLRCADAARLPFSEGHFDLIVSNLGINNFDDPPAVLAECARVAKLQARLVLTTNVKGHMQAFYEVYREVLDDLEKTRYLGRLAANEAHRGSRTSICEQVEAAGFDVTKVVEDHFHLRFLDGSALLRHSLTRFGFLDGWRTVVDAEDEQEVFAALEMRLNDLAHRNRKLTMRIPMLYVEARRR